MIEGRLTCKKCPPEATEEKEVNHYYSTLISNNIKTEATEEKTCEWEIIGHRDFWTACGTKRIGYDITSHCPYCGGKIVEKDT